MAGSSLAMAARAGEAGDRARWATILRGASRVGRNLLIQQHGLPPCRAAIVVEPAPIHVHAQPIHVIGR
jgi:hypothetical protein